MNNIKSQQILWVKINLSVVVSHLSFLAEKSNECKPFKIGLLYSWFFYFIFIAQFNAEADIHLARS